MMNLTKWICATENNSKLAVYTYEHVFIPSRSLSCKLSFQYFLMENIKVQNSGLFKFRPVLAMFK